MRRISCFLLMLTLLLTTAVVAWGTVPTDGEVTPSLVNVSRSKTATVLDKDYQSTVTLSLPSAEEKILTAEYALDFAVQAVNRALLVSLEAIEAQRLEEEKEGNKL